MKIQRRIFAILLTVVLTFSALAGCKNKQVEVDLSDEEEVTTSTVNQAGGSTDDVVIGGSSMVVSTTQWGKVNIKDNIVISDKDVLKKNLKGAQIILYGFSKPDASKSKTDAAMAKVYSDLEKSLNCKIKFVESDAAKTQQQTILNVRSSTHFAHILYSSQNGVVGYLTSDLLHDLSKFKGSIDLSQDYMNVGDGVNAFHLGSGYWAVNDPHYLSIIGSYIYYNKRIMKEVTGDENHPYKLMKQDKWNISTWRELSKKLLKNLTVTAR